MASSDLISLGNPPEHSFVTLFKRTQSGSGEPHVLPVDEIDTIEASTPLPEAFSVYSCIWEQKLRLFSHRIFDTDILPRIFTENNCPIPHGCWADILHGAGRSSQRFYLEVYPKQYTKCSNYSRLHTTDRPGDKSPPSKDINLVIFLEYPTGLFSIPPDDVIVEPISPDLLFETLASNMKSSLSREFHPNSDFSIVFETKARGRLSPGKTLAECDLSNGELVHCRLKDLKCIQTHGLLDSKRLPELAKL